MTFRRCNGSICSAKEAPGRQVVASVSRRVRFAFLSLASCLLAGCGDDLDSAPSGGGGATATSPDAAALHGAWFALDDQLENKEKEYCMVFCANQRLFFDDKDCVLPTKRYVEYELEGDQLVARDALGVQWSSRIDVEEDVLKVTFAQECCRDETLPSEVTIRFARVASEHLLCASDDVKLAEPDQDP